MGMREELWIEDGTVREYRGEGDEIVIPEGVTDIGDKAFAGCRSLKRVVLPESLKSIGYGAFAECRDLTEIRIPEGTVLIREAAFYHCTGLREVTVPGRVFRISDYAFGGCGHLDRAELREGIRSIGYRSFYECGSLKDLILPEGLTSIGGGALEDCGSLELIRLPESLRMITGDLPVPYAVCHTKSQAAHVSFPIYLGGPVTDLPERSRQKALDGFFYGLMNGIREVDRWRRSYLPYIRKIMKEYVKGDREDRDLLHMLIRESFPTRMETERLTQRYTELGDIETTALLLDYQREQFGKKGGWDLSL